MVNDNKALAPIETNVFLTFDRLDDDQIIQEMKGAALTEYVYEFNSGGKTVRGLSKTGTDDASRFMAVKYGEVLREVDAWLEKEDDEAGYFKALVKRFVVNKEGVAIEMDSAVGHKRQPKRNGSNPNPFWYEQGGQKALRNAKQKLIPETIKQAVIQSYVEQGKVRRVRVEEVANKPATVTPEPAAAAPIVESVQEAGERKTLLIQIKADAKALMLADSQLNGNAQRAEGATSINVASLHYLRGLAEKLKAQKEGKGS